MDDVAYLVEVTGDPSSPILSEVCLDVSHNPLQVWGPSSGGSIVDAGAVDVRNRESGKRTVLLCMSVSI